MKKLNVIISILFLFLNTEFSFPQSNPDQICGSEFVNGGNEIALSLKPVTSNFT